MPNNNLSRQHVLSAPTSKDSIHARVRNALRMVNHLRGGKEASAYTLLSRKDFISSDTINVILGVTADADQVQGVPKLALLVVSTTLREKIEAKPEMTEIKVVSPSFDLPSVAILMNWVKNLVLSQADTTVKVPVPTTLGGKAKLVHAAYLLGMSRYVDHVTKSFKNEVRTEIPRPEDCLDIENYAIAADHEIIKASGERLGYLLRTNKYPGGRPQLRRFLAHNEKLEKAVRDADARAFARRQAAQA